MNIGLEDKVLKCSCFGQFILPIMSRKAAIPVLSLVLPAPKFQETSTDASSNKTVS